ncbi:MAG: AtpZ/AtpI family protein [Pseudomonadota bacterium]
MASDTDKNTPPSLRDFSDRLDAKTRATAEREQAKDRKDGQGQALGQGMRLASELLAATLVGLGIGLGIDRLTGLPPLGLLAGLFIGFSAGLRNAMRSMALKGADKANADKGNANATPASHAADTKKYGDEATH